MAGEEIRTREEKDCYLCHKEGRPLYAGMTDRLFGVPGVWGVRKCGSCGLMWLDPRPVSEDIPKTYATYMTHAAEPKSRMEVVQQAIALLVLASTHQYQFQPHGSFFRRVAGRILSIVPFCRDTARRYVMNLRGDRRGKLLDIGCGDGKYLADMKALGWDAVGVEPDPEAAKIAREHYGLSVVTGMLHEADFPPESFDAITLKHVIEHVEHPVELIRNCFRILRPGGTLTIATPNTDCLQHRLFNEAWLELDPPRHLHLFSLSTLAELVRKAVPGGCEIEDARSVSGNTAQISVVSRAIRREGRWAGHRLSTRQMLEGVGFLLAEEVLKQVSPRMGEELLMTVVKNTSRAS
jgi:2-polyprenyl-3-methyl-5-hydroxy-6-metoxy-1,4-benzoquinol methylase